MSTNHPFRGKGYTVGSVITRLPPFGWGAKLRVAAITIRRHVLLVDSGSSIQVSGIQGLFTVENEKDKVRPYT